MDYDSDDAVTLKSDGTNYLLWTYMMRNFEIEGELWDYVSGSATRPDPKDKDYINLIKHWESMNSTALYIINFYVDSSLKKRLDHIKSAKDAWDYLAGLYAHGGESNFAKKYRLEREIEGVKQSGFPIAGLYRLMQCYWLQLDEMEPKELSDLESYKKYREESRLVQLLMALPDKFEDIRKSMMERSPLPTVSEAVQELQTVERRLTYDQFSSLSLDDKDCPAKKTNNDQTKRSRRRKKDSPQSTSSSTPGSGKYQPPFRREGNCSSMVSSAVKILSYNVWFQDLEIHKRMEALGELIQLHSPDVICFQGVTPDIYNIFKVSSWWNSYNCSASHQMASKRRNFCMQLSKLPVKSFSCKPFSNSTMLRELWMAEIEVRGKLLTVSTSHLESPCPAPPKWDQMHSEERIAQAKEAVNFLKKFPNVVFCGDMNWDEKSDGKFPLSDGWIDAWADLRPGESGWTYDTVSNPMLSWNRPLQKRPDRFICNLCDFKLIAIDMIGMEAIPGVSYMKEKKVKKGVQKSMLPVLPSNHYGLLLRVNIQ
ncbi:uncharacterized protein LOC126727081 isoform X1 [Quercus robur]|uniref:uncharacterized protein LOC126727081 isoform X1 n=1 Tax=Quercus robur TaxID=38942 RepID=UPI0021625EC6|nr:uncharacterized protein LOC126727081 isoform X1 [Quercus robur]